MSSTEAKIVYTCCSRKTLGVIDTLSASVRKLQSLSGLLDIAVISIRALNYLQAEDARDQDSGRIHLHAGEKLENYGAWHLRS